VIRAIRPGSGLDGARGTATLVVLVVALWTLLVLARPLTAGKVGIVAAMAAAAAAVAAVPALGERLFRLEVTGMGLVVAGVVGVLGAFLVELVQRTSGWSRAA
jgi:cation-transporting ATPase E